ncbi:MAG: DEAD/DEAH box helicase [Cyanobacteria bacterium]|nr:DEAD/DEAH box helicase [Cyanobacteria bacterium CG_2015-16_32_12]NCO77646.1 DEAD/DEAH box helicase [Cyanobacteria bacterium CG_2015-22_32_23]NCQ04298.1 DEAD/DEAH box helicase [Cyanobacteria bacterium CG_2015-09_32_10]NCQ42943.1 DEAD/DEAH box helicase [Cyanobacteria bacterium CG_2015-04_32_10]NCS84630.1 DEAD/DEAH box helicase [Cyanobacteria bacterium CG_2015-02_32_10]
MSRASKLTYDRGTLILHPPPKGKAWIDFATWDDRIEKFRIPAIYYRSLIEILENQKINFIDCAKEFFSLDIESNLQKTPYPHQLEGLEAWNLADKKGVVVLPTAGGKTYLAQLAMTCTNKTTLIVVPTLDLMQQWYAQIEVSFPKIKVGLLGGGSHDSTPILIATYHSAAIHAKTLGNLYGLLIFDECHHLPTDFFRVIAEESIAPYRLGLTATPDREDGSHRHLDNLIGKVVYRKTSQDLSGNTLAQYQVIPIKVTLAKEEKEKYQTAIKIRNDFLRSEKISLSSLNGWQSFIKASARSSQGRRAMIAHRESKEIASGTSAKLKILSDLIKEHYPDKILVFTNDNATVYRISQEYLIPAITHQTPVKERHQILTKYRTGEYKILAASHVLNEGVDVPDAKIAIILSGTGSTREYIQRLGRILRKANQKEKLAILYEVIAEDTSEEKTAAKRKGEGYQSPSKNQGEILLYPQNNYHNSSLKAAESKKNWQEED